MRGSEGELGVALSLKDSDAQKYDALMEKKTEIS